MGWGHRVFESYRKRFQCFPNPSIFSKIPCVWLVASAMAQKRLGVIHIQIELDQHVDS